MANSKEIAQTILSQFCTAFMMIGAKKFAVISEGAGFIDVPEFAHYGGLQLDIPKPSTRLLILLTPMDTYTLVFGRVRRVKGVPTWTTKKIVEGIYVDRVAETISEQTGLYTKF